MLEDIKEAIYKEDLDEIRELYFRLLDDPGKYDTEIEYVKSSLKKRGMPKPFIKYALNHYTSDYIQNYRGRSDYGYYHYHREGNVNLYPRKALTKSVADLEDLDQRHMVSYRDIVTALGARNGSIASIWSNIFTRASFHFKTKNICKGSNTRHYKNSRGEERRYLFEGWFEHEGSSVVLSSGNNNIFIEVEGVAQISFENFIYRYDRDIRYHTAYVNLMPDSDRYCELFKDIVRKINPGERSEFYSAIDVIFEDLLG